MFTVDNHKITFVHINTEVGQKSTLCKILDKDTKEVISLGVALVSPKDQYNKNTGRKVALKKALAKLTLTPEQRKIYWDNYFLRRGIIN